MRPLPAKGALPRFPMLPTAEQVRKLKMELKMDWETEIGKLEKRIKKLEEDIKHG